jgi:hypothetical protein
LGNGIYAEKGTAMTQHDPLYREAAEAAEALEDAYREVTADGVVEGTEIVYLHTHVRLVVLSTQRSAAAIDAGLATIRGGADSYRATVLLREVERLNDPVEAA